MSNGGYTNDHKWVGATHVPLSEPQAKMGNRRGTTRVDLSDVKIDILEVYCEQCRRPFDAVNGKPCPAAENRDHLIGGPTGERAKRNHPAHDCERYGCALPKGQGVSLVSRVG
jgi:hypothetical protein